MDTKKCHVVRVPLPFPRPIHFGALQPFVFGGCLMTVSPNVCLIFQKAHLQSCQAANPLEFIWACCMKKTLVAFQYFIASYTPLKMNGWNQKITQLKRKIIFQKLPFLGSMFIFQGAAYNVLFINIILIWHYHYTLSITRFSYIFSLKPTSQGQQTKLKTSENPGHPETPNQLGGTQARKFTKKKPPSLCWVYEGAPISLGIHRHILRWWRACKGCPITSKTHSI